MLYRIYLFVGVRGIGAAATVRKTPLLPRRGIRGPGEKGVGALHPPMSGGSFVWRKAFSFGGLKIGEEGGKDAYRREV